MKKLYFVTICVLLLICTSSRALASGLDYRFYGFVRADGSIDSRRSVTAFEGLFLLYPADILSDANGEDLNTRPSSGFYGFNSRAGVNVGGLRLFNADITAQLEADFAGFSGANGNSSVLRVRQAYMKMKWDKTALTIGQTWHPTFSPVTPDVISLSVGAPFNPFNRSPQLRFDYLPGRFTLTAAAIWQFQFTSPGPAGKSNIYQRNALLPQLYAGAGYSHGGITGGAGVNYLTIKPRTEAENGGIYKVDESLRSLSYMAYLKYEINLFSIGAKTIYGQNLSDLTMVGGYGVSSRDAVTGEAAYTNFNHSSTWLNINYGKRYRAGIFGGYTKNLGTDKALLDGSPLYGDGLALNDLYRLCGTLTYNVPHFMLGVEYEMTTAGYGDQGAFDYSKGRYRSSHDVTNHRVVAVVSYSF